MFTLIDIFSDTLFPFFTLCVMLFNFKKLPGDMKIIFWYLFITVVLFLISNYLADRTVNNLFLYHLYTLVTFTAVSCFLYIQKLDVLLNKLIKINYAIVFIFIILNSVYFEPLTVFDSNAIMLTGFFTIVYSIAYFILILRNDQNLTRTRTHTFWAISGFFIYASGTFLIFYFFKYSNQFFKSLASQFWQVQNIILIFKNLFFLIATFICIRYRPVYRG